MTGWVKLHRRLKDKAFYKRPHYLALWVHLLLSANHGENEFLWNGSTIKLKPGQLITGRKQLRFETGIPETTIERILSFLEKEGQIGQQKTTKYRLLTILNWDTYQQADNKRTTSGQQADTNKNDKKEKNDKNSLASDDAKNNMGLRKYNENDHQDDMPSIDGTSGEYIQSDDATKKAAERELNEKIRHNLRMTEEMRGMSYGSGKDMQYHVSIYLRLLGNGWSHEHIIGTLIELINSPYWKEKREVGEYPGMNTVESYVRNKQPK